MSDRTCIEVTTVIQRITTEKSFTTTYNSGSSNGLDVLVIIGISIGCILLIIVIVVIYKIYKKIQGKQQAENICITERGESTPLNKNHTKEDESLSGTIEIATTHFYGGDVERDKKSKADPVDDDETFVKEPEDSNDDNLLSRAEGGAPATEFHILSAQQPQGEQTDMRPIVHRPTTRVEAQVHAQQSSLPQLLTVHPVNDDSGRFLSNGETSLPMQYHNGNIATNSAMPTARPNSMIVVESGNFPSDQYDPNRSL
ncbi:uncharacterized protein LOC127723527 [Mytilus californianus]|uniref:uncharacterized protein LOC127723527 n=1 Tax=Mytilus californianus TaxID=6549 RepID=UPI002245AA77|nr:uncharacterized protein LOC127723527 [Mytilus californianus]